MRSARQLVNIFPFGGRFLRLVDRFRHARWIMRAGVFDYEWYGRQANEEFRTRFGTVVHYLRRGRRRGFTPSPFFNPGWYDPEWWAVGGREPLIRYLLTGAGPYGPNPRFSEAAWLSRYPAAGTHPGGALGHFLSVSEPNAEVPSTVHTTTMSTVELRRLAESAYVTWTEGIYHARKRPQAQVNVAADRRFRAKWSSQRAHVLGDGPLVSIITPVRNRPTQVLAAIASVQRQTTADWELIIVDDGSTDPTPDAISIVAVADPRIHLIRTDGQGVSAARNRAVAEARGDYVAFLDSDNVWLPDFLQLMTAAMSGDGLEAAYCSIEMVAGPDRNYLAFEGDLADLEYGNHIDLNTLVVRRSTLVKSGGFDPTLRRMVDYDLVLGIARIGDIAHLPFVGAVYDASDETGTRISNTESPRWGDVVKNRRLIDWPTLEREVGHRVAGRVSVLISSTNDAHATTRCITHLRRHAGGQDVEFVILDNGGSRPSWIDLEFAFHGQADVRLIRSIRNVGPVLGTNLAFASASGEFVVITNPHLVVDSPWAGELAAALADHAVAAVQPLVLDRAGLVHSAGISAIDSADSASPAFASHLVGFAREDAIRLAPIPLAGPAGPMVAFRAIDFVPGKGLDPLLDLDAALADLAWRVGVRGAQHSRLLTEIAARYLPFGGGQPERSTGPSLMPADDGQRAVLFGRSMPQPRSGATNPWAEAGLAARVATTDSNESASIIVKTVPTSLNGQRRRRWAIKTAAPAGPVGDVWGDVHFAAALADALTSLGQIAVVDRREGVARRTSALDDVNVVLRGLDKHDPVPGALNFLWVISHPDQVHVDELAAYDHVFAASLSWSAKATAAGLPVEAMLQATDPARFKPGSGRPAAPRVLFVGNSRGVYRPIVAAAIEAELPIVVYGSGWREFLPPERIGGEFVPNHALASLYESAEVVLNDHWSDMAREGFLSNRLFDAVAAGARVISDPVEGLAEVFGAAVEVAKNAADLSRLIAKDGTRALGSWCEPMELAKASELVRTRHSFLSRAARMIEVADQLQPGDSGSRRQMLLPVAGSTVKAE